MAQLFVALWLLATGPVWRADALDPADTGDAFATVFAMLPAEVTVFPSENYYYWRVETGSGETVWGNFRLAANRRDRGGLSFAAGQHHRDFSATDGVAVERLGAMEYAVTFREKRVRFHLNPLDQSPPKKFALRPGEQFVQRTHDESGLQFFLLFNTRFNDFLWVLNEEDGVDVPEAFIADGPSAAGQRSGFVFWQDSDRKVLAAVSRANIDANNYYDGPFDQLADNYAKQTGLKKFLIAREPGLADQIDDYGNHKNRDPATRVALTNYLQYTTAEEAVDFIRNAARGADPCRAISKARSRR